MNIVELFSGIGSQRKALANIGVEHKVLNIAEWYIPAILAYDSIHNGKRDLSEVENFTKKDLIDYLGKFTFSNNGKKPLDKKNFRNLNINILKHLYIANKRTNNLVSIDKVHGNELPDDIDVLTYSFPCQDLSNVGAFHGYKSGIDKNKKSRSGLLWEVERIMYERFECGRQLPKILLMENVSTLLSPRHNKNFQDWIDSLEQLGYYSVYHTLNARNFGIPQNRERIFMISILIQDMNDNDVNVCKAIIDETFHQDIPMRTLDEFLKIDYEGVYLEEAIEAQPNKTESREKIYNENYYLYGDNPNRELAYFCRTITTRQDRHPNAGVIEFDGPKNNFRFLTAREVFLLMGFTEADYESIKNDNFNRNITSKYFSRDKFYTLAGNSIVVNVLEEIFQRIFEVYNIMTEAE